MSTICTKDYSLKVSPFPDPFAYYKLDEASLAPELVDQVNDENLFWTGIQNVVSVPGKLGTAIAGPGYGPFGSAFATGPYPYWATTGSFTVRFWFKWDGLPMVGSGYQIVTMNNTPAWLSWYVGRWNPDNINAQMEFLCQTNGVPGYVTTAYITGGVWNRVIAWYEDGVGVGIKLNNDAPVLQALTDNRAGISVGNFDLEADSTISIDELSIWNVKLTDAQMTADWNSGTGITYPTP